MFSLRLAATALCASYALAQSSSTVTLFLPMANQTGVVASVITAVSYFLSVSTRVTNRDLMIDRRHLQRLSMPWAVQV